MQPLLAVPGGLLIALALVDALVTTLAAATPAGPVTARMARRLSGAARQVAGRVSWARTGVGPVVLLVTVATWIGMLWAGWWLVLLADDGAVVHASDGAPASAWSRLYFAAYTLFTLGNGEFLPATDPWRVTTGVATVLGLALVTTAITYLVPVVTAVTDRHTQAERIAGLGDSAQEILVRAWGANGFDELAQQVQDLAGSIALTSQRHLAYPVLHFFHGRDRAAAFAVNVAALDEAVTMLETAVIEARRPHPLHLRAWRHAVHRLLEVIEGDFGGPADVPPPDPDLGPLRDAGIPLLPDADVADGIAALETHRRRLHGFVAESGWPWSAVSVTNEHPGS